MNSITCPHCKKSFEPGEAIVHDLEEKILKEQEEKHKAELEKAKKDIQLETEKQVRQKIQQDLEQSKKEKEKLELQLAQMAKLQEEADKKRKEDEEKFRQEERKKAAEASKYEILELKKQLDDTKKSLDEAKRKADQKSQQLQGEVLELDFENQLREIFEHDEFVPIPKGVEGGDIWQKVVLNGKEVGSILWETKRTKAWSKGWLVKLKNDASKIEASECIIVSNVLPEGVKNFSRVENVWVTDYESAISICRFVRYFISRMNSMKSAVSKTDEEWGQIRDYMMSDVFLRRMQSHVETIGRLKILLEQEKRSAQVRWKRQLTEIDRLDNNHTNLYADLKAIVKELPDLDGVNTQQISQDEDNEQTFL